jgi:hypothetical protein
MQEVKNILVTEGRGEDIIITQFIDNEQFKPLIKELYIGYKEPLDMKSLEEIIKNKNNEKEWEDNIKELDEKFQEIDFTIAMSSINILRYISHHLEQLEFPVRHHMMNVKDVPMLFVTLMEMKPWLRKIKKYNSESKKDEEITQIYENNN